MVSRDCDSCACHEAIDNLKKFEEDQTSPCTGVNASLFSRINSVDSRLSLTKEEVASIMGGVKTAAFLLGILATLLCGVLVYEMDQVKKSIAEHQLSVGKSAFVDSNTPNGNLDGGTAQINPKLRKDGK